MLKTQLPGSSIEKSNRGKRRKTMNIPWKIPHLHGMERMIKSPILPGPRQRRAHRDLFLIPWGRPRIAEWHRRHGWPWYSMLDILRPWYSLIFCNILYWYMICFYWMIDMIARFILDHRRKCHVVISSDDFWEMNEGVMNWLLWFLWHGWGNNDFDCYDFGKIEWGIYVLILFRKMQQSAILTKKDVWTIMLFMNNILSCYTALKWV